MPSPRASGSRAMAGHPRHRPYPHGDRIGGHDRRRAPFLDRRRSMPRPQRLALQPQHRPPRPRARRPDLSRPRTTPRSPPAISPGACARAMSLGEALEDGARRSRRLLHLRRRHRDGFAVLRDPDRLQAGGDGRDRRLGGVRHRISRARRPARRRDGADLGAGAAPRSISGSAASDADGRSRRHAAPRAQRRAAQAAARDQRDALATSSIRTGSTRSPSASMRRSRSRSTGMSATIAPA